MNPSSEEIGGPDGRMRQLQSYVAALSAVPAADGEEAARFWSVVSAQLELTALRLAAARRLAEAIGTSLGRVVGGRQGPSSAPATDTSGAD